MPQGRIMHEMGHIASYVSHAWKFDGSCYDRNGNQGWEYTSEEHACAAFEEAFATFLADSSLYNHDAVAPHSCLSSSYCPTGMFNIETSPACGGINRRWPLTAMRYLWDIFDSRNDGEGLSEGLDGLWWRIYRNYQHYESGTSDHQADEHWNSTYTAIDNYDGRSCDDYRWNYINYYSYDTLASYTLNCSPP